MFNIITYLVTFIIIYLLYIIFVYNRKHILEKFRDGKELRYLKIKYGIKINSKNLKQVSKLVFLANSLIFTIALIFISLFDSILLKIAVTVIVVLILILLVYHLIGIYLKNKQGVK